MTGQLHLGCPVWACPEWVGDLYRSTNRRTWLKDYSSVFNTVEGNSSFYALPSPDVVRNWARETMPGFKFSLKFPREITHDAQLVGAHQTSLLFFELLQVLADEERLGPTFLQLPPSFSGGSIPQLRSYLKAIPREFPIAVEARHADFFDDQEYERQFDDVLTESQCDRVLFDSRALFSRPADDAIEKVSQSRKPRSPLRHTVTYRHPFVRFVGRNRIELAAPWIEEWADVVAKWIKQGLAPYVFTHAPDDAHAPRFAETFHAAVRNRLPDLPPLEPWPGRQRPRQLHLFS